MHLPGVYIASRVNESEADRQASVGMDAHSASRMRVERPPTSSRVIYAERVCSAS